MLVSATGVSEKVAAFDVTPGVAITTRNNIRNLARIVLYFRLSISTVDLVVSCPAVGFRFSVAHPFRGADYEHNTCASTVRWNVTFKLIGDELMRQRGLTRIRFRPVTCQEAQRMLDWGRNEFGLNLLTAICNAERVQSRLNKQQFSRVR